MTQVAPRHTLDQPLLSEKLALARTQLLDAKEALAQVMADVVALPAQLKTNVVMIIEGAAERVRAAERNVEEASALCEKEAAEEAATSLRLSAEAQNEPPTSRWREHGGMLVFGLMCAAAGAAHLLVGW